MQKDLAEVDQNFMSIWRSGNYAALVRDKIKLAGTGLNNSDSTAGIGTLLPYRSINNDGSMKVLVPHKKPDGFAGEAEIIIPAGSAVVWPYPDPQKCCRCRKCDDAATPMAGVECSETGIVPPLPETCLRLFRHLASQKFFRAGQARPG